MFRYKTHATSYNGICPESGEITGFNIDWHLTKIRIPRKSVLGTWIKPGPCYKRKVWRYVGPHDRLVTEYGTAFDILVPDKTEWLDTWSPVDDPG